MTYYWMNIYIYTPFLCPLLISQFSASDYFCKAQQNRKQKMSNYSMCTVQVLYVCVGVCLVMHKLVERICVSFAYSGGKSESPLSLRSFSVLFLAMSHRQQKRSPQPTRMHTHTHPETIIKKIYILFHNLSLAYSVYSTRRYYRF